MARGRSRGLRWLVRVLPVEQFLGWWNYAGAVIPQLSHPVVHPEQPAPAPAMDVVAQGQGQAAAQGQGQEVAPAAAAADQVENANANAPPPGW